MNDLYNHQRQFLLRNPNKHLLSWEPGTGKSRTAIEWAKTRGMTLVICPKALKRNWQRELDKWGSEAVIYSKEEFRKVWDVLPKYNTIVIDEAHYFFSTKSQMSKSLLSYIKRWKSENILLLTASPYLSSPWSIFVAAKILGYNWNYGSFKSRFFNDVRMGSRWVPIVKKGIEEEIGALVKGIGSTVRLDECIDVPTQSYETEFFVLTKEQKKAIDNIEEINHIVRFTKAHQIEQGTLKGDGYTEDRFYPSDKTERIVEICEENPKVAIFCRYNLQIDHSAEVLKDLGKPVFIIRGDVKDRDEVIQEAEKEPEAIILIQAACSEGYQLPSFGVIIFASLDFSLKNFIQAQGRFLRIDKPKKNLFIHLVVEGEIDEDVYNCIMKKMDFNIAIYKRNN